jgi:glycerol kinase
MSILVVDIGTTGIRSAIVRQDGTMDRHTYERFAPLSPAPGLVEFDATAMRDAILRLAHHTLAGERVHGVGIATQRASTIAWDARTGQPLSPALGWQDLRTLGDCLTIRAEHGLAIAPNQTATKAKWLVESLDAVDRSSIRIGTVDSWAAYVLSDGRLHVTDHTNAAVTGLYDARTGDWSDQLLDVFGLDRPMMPIIIDTSGCFGEATALPGAPTLAALVGDQQASLVGQGCIEPGDAKITFGTGGMLDVVVGTNAPESPRRSTGGTFPIVAFAGAHGITWGIEAIMLSAGSNIDWLCDDMGMLDHPEDSAEIAASVADSAGVTYVPALLGLGTPKWDYGARGTLLGLTRGSTRAHVVRAVLEGVAHRGADLVEAAEKDAGFPIDSLRVDGGMSRNDVFIDALANATNRPVDVSPVTEATTLGAAYLAGAACGTWSSIADACALWSPRARVLPTGPFDRPRWHEAVERASGWIPGLSALDF